MTKIALVEDDPIVRSLLDAMLGGEYELVEFPSGREALAGLLRSPPDAILLDTDLGDMSGLEVLGQLRRHAKLERVPVIAMTGPDRRGGAGERERYIAAGFSDRLVKPFRDEGLVRETIGSCLGLRSASARRAEDAKATVRFDLLDAESLESEDVRPTVRFDRLDPDSD